MITHNGTYLLHATHHGMPIYAATLGGKMVIGWLQSATLQAIVAAFGSAEGTEVIRKTNDYLNRIATTDPQRALQISVFINEDPLLVCSLVETSKTRWLETDGLAFIEPNHVPNINSKFYFDFMFLELVGTYQGAYGNYMSEDTQQYRLISDNYRTDRFSAQFATKTWDANINIPIVGTRCTGSQEYRKCVINGVEYETPTQQGKENPTGLHLFRGSGGTSSASMGNVRSKVKFSMFKIESSGELIRDLVPCYTKAQGNGMLDIISLTFYPNANTQGSFTIQLTPKA